MVVGLALAHWAWRPVGSAGGDVARDIFLERLTKDSQARRIYGYIDYPIVASAKLQDYMVTSSMSAGEILQATGDALIELAPGARQQDIGPLTVAELLDGWRQVHGPCLQCESALRHRSLARSWLAASPACTWWPPRFACVEGPCCCEESRRGGSCELWCQARPMAAARAQSLSRSNPANVSTRSSTSRS